MLTKSGDVVLDPFNGAGSTTKAAFDLDRIGLGFDLSEQYNDYALSRLNSPSGVRSNQLNVIPVHTRDFVPGKSKGKTRHGAGLNARKS
jgi:hypothetical protein